MLSFLAVPLRPPGLQITRVGFQPGGVVSHFGSDLSFPALRQEPLEVAPDTFVIRAAMPSVGGTSTCLNSMLIRGVQPVIVDTGMVTNRATWFEDVFSLVAPEEVRWIFISHN